MMKATADDKEENMQQQLAFKNTNKAYVKPDISLINMKEMH